MGEDYGKRRLELSGPGYHSVGKEPLVTRSTLDLHLLEWDRYHHRWMACEYARPNKGEVIRLAPTIDGDRFVWKQDFDYALCHNPHIAVLVEEFEHMPAEQGTGHYDENGMALFELEDQRRLVFSHFIELRDG